MVTCLNCKEENKETLNFCKECGNPLNEEARRHFPELVKPKNSRIEKEI